MKQYIRYGERDYFNDYLRKITNNRLPDLNSQNIKTDWIGFSLHIMDNLATDFNFYMFFNETMSKMPPKFLFTQLGEAILDLCKLLDSRRKNKVCLIHILNTIEQNISDNEIREKYKTFKNDIVAWLDSKKDFIKNLTTIRDKFLAHNDIDEKSQIEYKTAFRNISIPEFIEISNITIQIYAELISSIQHVIIPNSFYTINEFHFIYECLRSLDKIQKNVTEKNRIIHNIDLELQEIKKLIK